MIELITGLPGNGKTLFTISDIKSRAAKENRPVFYHGIPELSLDWEKLDDPKKWASVPPGSIVVIDEAQKTFRNRSLGSVPPEFVTDLETHRHLGIDLVLITQHPSLIDPAVRRLSGRHRHMVRLWGMEASTVHKWDSVKDNCDKARSDSEKTKWAFDKSVYTLYKSAEQHTMKRQIPMRAKLLLLVPVALALCAWVVYSSVFKKQLAPAATVASAQQSNSGQPGSLVPASPHAARFDPIQDAREYTLRAEPRIVGLPQTAPKYDELTKPVRVPVPAACIQRKDSCKCFTQQGTPMGVEFNMCIEFARNGWFQEFDADRDRQDSERTKEGVRVLASRPDTPRDISGGQVVVFDKVTEAPKAAISPKS